jgi:hypothetical protein
MVTYSHERQNAGLANFIRPAPNCAHDALPAALSEVDHYVRFMIHCHQKGGASGSTSREIELPSLDRYLLPPWRVGTYADIGTSRAVSIPGEHHGIHFPLAVGSGSK